MIKGVDPMSLRLKVCSSDGRSVNIVFYHPALTNLVLLYNIFHIVIRLRH